MVVAIDGSWVLSSAGRGDFLSSGEQRLDDFVSEHDQGRDRAQTGRHHLVATRRYDPPDDLFAAEFLQIVCGLAGTVGGSASVEAVKPSGETDNMMTASAT